jgi:hypothetical protein
MNNLSEIAEKADEAIICLKIPALQKPPQKKWGDFRFNCGFYPAAAQNLLAVIAYSGLPRRNP